MDRRVGAPLAGALDGGGLGDGDRTHTMVISSSIARGFRAAVRRPALTVTLWLWSLLLGAIVALPAWATFGGAFNLFPEADRLLDRFDLRILFEAFHYDRSSVPGTLAGALAGAALVALVGNSLVAGGVLDVLTTDDGRRFLHRFMRGAGRFFGRFVRLLLLAAGSFLLCAAAVAVAGSLVTLLMSQAGSEMVRILGYVVVPAAVLLLFAFFSLVLDYARTRMVLEGSRGAFLAWFRSLGFVLRHLVATGIVALVFAAFTGVLFAASLGYQARAASNTWLLILALLAVQQATMFLRFGLRVGSVGATVEVSNRLGNVGPLRRVRVEPAAPRASSVPPTEVAPPPEQATETRLQPEPARNDAAEAVPAEPPAQPESEFRLKPEPTPGQESTRNEGSTQDEEGSR
jgi:hypothetical protein